MKTKLSLLLAAVAFASVLFIAPQPVTAQTLPAAPVFANIVDVTTPAPAAVDSPAATPAPVVVTPTPVWLSTEFFAALFAAAAGIVAIWQNKEKKTAQKVSASLVVAMEAASKIPVVAEHEKAIKAKLRQKLEASGAQPVVERLLKNLT